jgi:peptide/nickel transport system permease protein
MMGLIARRLLLSVPLVLIVTAISFALMSLLPGSVAETILGTQATPAKVAALDHQLGVDRPLVGQYTHWLRGAVHGDLGTSIADGTPVASTLNAGLDVTLSLVLAALVLAVALGIAIGTYTAVAPGRLSRAVDALALVGLATPSFCVALVLVLVFAVKLHALPAVGYTSLASSASGWARSLVLPATALAVGMVGSVAKQTRASMRETLGRPYIVGLRANGIAEGRIVLKHGLRNAALPVVTVVGLLFVGSLTGAVVIEQVFVLPGLGSALVAATAAHDVPMIQGVALYLALLVVAVNLVVDLAYAALNPRVRRR